jgi:hypothetical protein
MGDTIDPKRAERNLQIQIQKLPEAEVRIRKFSSDMTLDILFLSLSRKLMFGGIFCTSDLHTCTS